MDNYTTLGVADKHWYYYDPAGRIARWRRHPGYLPEDIRIKDFDYNLSDELIQSIDRLNANIEVDRRNWGLDDGGNWLSTTQTTGNLMQTRKHNVMNQLTDVGGAGQMVVEGTINEHAAVTVNGKSAVLFADPVIGPAMRYRAAVPVAEGGNTFTVTATDQDEEVTTKQWQVTVQAVQRSFTYDANGNMLTDSVGRVFTWDTKNRLKRVTVGGKHYEWDYDYRDRRVREYEWNVGAAKPVTCKQFIWHGNDIVQERDGTSATAGTVARNHYFGGFTIGATVSTAAKYQTFTDHLGHVREVVASSGTSPAIGTIVARYDYDPYQGPTKLYQHPSTNIEATFQTIGRYYHHEASGLELALYRAYDAELGRWISEDPIEEEGGLNIYGYIANNPITWVDLLGLTPNQRYDSYDTTVQKALDYDEARTKKTRKECGGEIYKDGEKFYYKARDGSLDRASVRPYDPNVVALHHSYAPAPSGMEIDREKSREGHQQKADKCRKPIYTVEADGSRHVTTPEPQK